MEAEIVWQILLLQVVISVAVYLTLRLLEYSGRALILPFHRLKRRFFWKRIIPKEYPYRKLMEKMEPDSEIEIQFKKYKIGGLVEIIYSGIQCFMYWIRYGNLDRWLEFIPPHWGRKGKIILWGDWLDQELRHGLKLEESPPSIPMNKVFKREMITIGGIKAKRIEGSLTAKVETLWGQWSSIDRSYINREYRFTIASFIHEGKELLILLEGYGGGEDFFDFSIGNELREEDIKIYKKIHLRAA